MSVVRNALIALGILLGVICIAALLRPAPRQQHVSLITHSLDRPPE